MKQIVKYIFCFLLAVGLSACSSQPEAKPEADSSQTKQVSAARTEQSSQTASSSDSSSSEQAADLQALPALHVDGTQLLNEQDEEVVLQGFSTFGINYEPEFISKEVFEFLRDKMDSQVIRIAMYTAGDNGYCTGGSQEELKQLVENGVEYAGESGQYAIIDWHILSDGNPNDHIDQAKTFFDEMSKKYAGNPGVFYEICNEPNGNTTWQDVKDYANVIIPIIRANDKNALILVGTPQSDQYEVEASKSPLQNVSNVMYTVHFYAATHKQEFRDQLTEAHHNGLPMFVSEFGISEASGNGALDEQSGDAWIELLNKYGISRVAWSVSNKDESSAIFKPGTKADEVSLSDLSPYGQWLYTTYTEKKLPDDAEADNEKSASVSSDSSGIEKSLSAVNSWQSDGKTFTQFSLTLTNTGSSDLADWKVSIPFNRDFQISDSWNGEYSANGKNLIITPASYNNEINGGDSVSDIGFILKSDGPLQSSIE